MEYNHNGKGITAPKEYFRFIAPMEKAWFYERLLKKNTA